MQDPSHTTEGIFVAPHPPSPGISSLSPYFFLISCAGGTLYLELHNTRTTSSSSVWHLENETKELHLLQNQVVHWACTYLLFLYTKVGNTPAP